MKTNISEKKLKEFGFLIGLIFPIIFGWFLPFLKGSSFKMWTLIISIPFLNSAIFRPDLLALPYKVWMKFGAILGWVNSRIVLGIIFFFILLPIAFIMKIYGHDPLRLKKTNKNSYREKKTVQKTNLKKIF